MSTAMRHPDPEVIVNDVGEEHGRSKSITKCVEQLRISSVETRPLLWHDINSELQRRLPNETSTRQRRPSQSRLSWLVLYSQEVGSSSGFSTSPTVFDKNREDIQGRMAYKCHLVPRGCQLLLPCRLYRRIRVQRLDEENPRKSKSRRACCAHRSQPERWESHNYSSGFCTDRSRESLTTSEVQ